jgi:hypothetical protein
VLDDVTISRRNRNKSIKKPITIKVKSDGRPKVPKITSKDGYWTKNVQDTLRKYILSHIRKTMSESLYQYLKYPLGYISGKPKVTISWQSLCQDPLLWIKPECFPDDFQWADPSKIRIGEVFRLLDHWKRRQEQHLKPLIWASTCPVLADVDRSSSSDHTSGQSSTDDSTGSHSDSSSLYNHRKSIENDNSSSNGERSPQIHGRRSSDVSDNFAMGGDDGGSPMESPRLYEKQFQYDGSRTQIFLPNSVY